MRRQQWNSKSNFSKHPASPRNDLNQRGWKWVSQVNSVDEEGCEKIEQTFGAQVGLHSFTTCAGSGVDVFAGVIRADKGNSLDLWMITQVIDRLHSPMRDAEHTGR